MGGILAFHIGQQQNHKVLPLWPCGKEKDLNSICITVKFGAAHSHVKGTKENIIPENGPELHSRGLDPAERQQMLLRSLVYDGEGDGKGGRNME